MSEEQRPPRYGLVVGPYALEFKHEEGAWPIELTLRVQGRKQLQEIVRTRRTVALLVKADARRPIAGGVYDEEIARGEAYCSPNDGFDYEVGRQTALYDLVRALPQEPKKAKTHLGRQLLAAYLNRPGALPWALDAEGKLVPEILAHGRAMRAAGNGFAAPLRKVLATVGRMETQVDQGLAAK